MYLAAVRTEHSTASAVPSWPLVCKICSADTRLLLLSMKKKHLNANLGIGDLNVNIWAGAGRGGGGS